MKLIKCPQHQIAVHTNPLFADAQLPMREKSGLARQQFIFVMPHCRRPRANNKLTN